MLDASSSSSPHRRPYFNPIKSKVLAGKNEWVTIEPAFQDQINQTFFMLPENSTAPTITLEYNPQSSYSAVYRPCIVHPFIEFQSHPQALFLRCPRFISTFYEDLNHSIPESVRIRNEFRRQREEWKYYFSQHVIEQINEDVAYRIGMVKYLNGGC